MFRQCEEERRLCMTVSLNAVHARRSIYDSEERIFGSDSRSHGQCMNKYRNTRTRCEKCSKLAITIPERRHVVVSLLLTLRIFYTLF